MADQKREDIFEVSSETTFPSIDEEALKQTVTGGIYLPDRKVALSFEIMTNQKRLISDYELRFSSYYHGWYCNIFNTCETTYNSNAFVIDKSTGQKILCTGVETACANRVDPPINYDPSKEGWYRYFSNATDFYIGFGKKDGKDQDVWGVAKCYFPGGGWIAWRWHSHA